MMRVTMLRPRQSGRFSRLTALLAIGGLPVAPGLAQQAPQPARAAPAPAQVQQIVPIPMPVAPPPVVPTIPLPKLSASQAAELTKILTDGPIEHGLRYKRQGAAIPTDNDALVREALDYARAVHSGRLAASDFDSNWGLRPLPYDPLPAFAAAVKSDRLQAWNTNLSPPYAGYETLKEGLKKYRQIDAAGGWKTVPAGPDLTLGSTGPRVAALRARLAVEDTGVAAKGDTFDAALKEAVIRAQRRYGLNPTGVVSSGTLAALNVSAGDRVRQIMANMERWRWLPEQLEKDRIQVNIAAAVVTVFDGDNPVMSMRGVTGRPGNETPMLQSSIHSIVLNPPWNVPTSIATKELFPKGSAYLARNGYKVIGTGAGRRLQQQAGPKSALGRYKFDFNNSFAVYLHDTPSQSTFGRYARLESHGCVRLEKPADLARHLLRDDPNWQPDAIQAAVDTGKTQRVPLKTQVAVYLLYWTAFATQNGTMSFRGDPYSWDKSLASKIEDRSAAQALAAR